LIESTRDARLIVDYIRTMLEILLPPVRTSAASIEHPDGALKRLKTVEDSVTIFPRLS
jgi:hypothetical protein